MLGLGPGVKSSRECVDARVRPMVRERLGQAGGRWSVGRYAAARVSRWGEAMWKQSASLTESCRLERSGVARGWWERV